MKVRAVDFVVYPVSDLGRAVAFYRDTLGLSLEMFSEEYGWAEFDCGNVTLALHGDQLTSPPGPGPRVALAVEDLASVYAELVEQGARTGGKTRDWGVCQSLEVFDPDGNSILLHHRADGSCGAAAGDVARGVDQEG